MADDETVRVDGQALQERLAGFIRGFGLHQPDRTRAAAGRYRCQRPTRWESSPASAGSRSSSSGAASGSRRARSAGWSGSWSREAGSTVSRTRPTGGPRSCGRPPRGPRLPGERAVARRVKFDRLLDAIPEEQRAEVMRALDVLAEALHADR